MVKTIDKERVLGKIKKEKSIIDFFIGAGTGVIISCFFSPDSIKSVARNPVDSSMEGIATIFNKAI